MIIEGSFESASTQQRREITKVFVRTHSSSSPVVIVSSSSVAADDLARELVAETGSSFGVYKFSFVQYVARLASRTLYTKNLVPISALGQQALVGRTLFETISRMTYFGPVADRPGFLDAAGSTIQELRLARVPTQFGSVNSPLADISLLASGFDGELSSLSSADWPAILSAAEQSIIAGTQHLVDCPTTFLDVPIHSRAVASLVNTIRQAAPGFLITVAAGDDLTLRFLKSGTFEHNVGREKGDGSLNRVRRNIFSPRVDVIPERTDDQLTFFSAPGEGREVAEIARRIIAESRTGIRFDQMAVVLRNPELYSRHIDSSLHRASIPTYFAHGTSDAHLAGRAFLCLLRCAAENLSAHRFAEYLSLGQVPDASKCLTWCPPSDPIFSVRSETTDADTQVWVPSRFNAPWKWEEFLVKAAVLGTVERWRERIEGYRAELILRLRETNKEEGAEEPGTPVSPELTNLDEFREFALPVIEKLAVLPQGGSWGDWIDSLQDLAIVSLKDPSQVLDLLSELHPLAAMRPVTLPQVVRVLDFPFKNLRIPPPKYRYGRVFVGTPTDIRGLEFEIAFVPGMSERFFPKPVRQDPILLDNSRRELSHDLALNDDRSAIERLGLRLAVGVASRKLVLSYSRMDTAQARPRVPSFYALDVARASRGKIPPVSTLESTASKEGGARLAWPAPQDPMTAIDTIEYDLAVLDPLLHSESGEHHKGRGRFLITSNPHFARSLRARWARWESKWCSYDGLVQCNADTRGELAKYSLADRPYSPSGLQRYATCPYQFYLSSILKLKVREFPSQPEAMDPAVYGEIFHEAQARVTRYLIDHGRVSFGLDDLDLVQKQVDEIVEAVAREFEKKLAPSVKQVWRNAVEEIRANLREIARRRTADSTWDAMYVEFGIGFEAGKNRDPASVATPALVAGRYKLRGILDLVERNRNNGTLRVTDYKTGKDDLDEGLLIGGGRRLQPLLYALALEQSIGERVPESRLYFATTRNLFAEHLVRIDQHARWISERLLEQVNNAIVTGFLPAAPVEGACDRCEYRLVCGPYEKIRVDGKEQSALQKLNQIRSIS